MPKVVVPQESKMRLALYKNKKMLLRITAIIKIPKTEKETIFLNKTHSVVFRIFLIFPVIIYTFQ